MTDNWLELLKAGDEVAVIMPRTNRDGRQVVRAAVQQASAVFITCMDTRFRRETGIQTNADLRWSDSNRQIIGTWSDYCNRQLRDQMIDRLRKAFDPWGPKEAHNLTTDQMKRIVVIMDEGASK